MLGTMLRSMTARARSAADQRERGLPESRGSVQARAVTRARTTEGKKTRPARPGRVPDHRPRPAPAAPLAHRPIGTAHRPGNRRVTPLRVLVCQQEDLGSHHLSVGRAAKAADPLKFSVLWRGEANSALRLWSPSSRDIAPHCSLRSDDSRGRPQDLKTRNEFMISCTKVTPPRLAMCSVYPPRSGERSRRSNAG